MNQLIIIIIIINLSFNVLVKSEYDLYDNESDESEDPYEWFEGRHRLLSPQPRAVSIKRKRNGVIISSGPDKDKRVTVPGCGRAMQGINTRIVGGQYATWGQFPWTVLIEYFGRPICGGAILNERWLITAAHCFKGLHSLESALTVRVGTIDNKMGRLYTVIRLTIHENYNYDGMESQDLALLKTSTVIGMEWYGEYKTICLPSKNSEPKSSSIVVSGWGRTGEYEDPSRMLKYIRLKIVDPYTCAKTYREPMLDFPDGYNIYKSQICASSRYKDACQGDSGGPAIIYENNIAVLVGVVSFGVGCATEYPGVYTKISHFTDWIASHMD